MDSDTLLSWQGSQKQRYQMLPSKFEPEINKAFFSFSALFSGDEDRALEQSEDTEKGVILLSWLALYMNCMFCCYWADLHVMAWRLKFKVFHLADASASFAIRGFFPRNFYI